jgi:hypothetical protein
MDWSGFDFLVAAVLLTAAVLAFLLFVRPGKSRRYRVVAAAMIIVVLLVVWLELAVGLFGSPFAGS